MKKSKRSSKKGIAIAAGIVVIFAAGIGAGIYFGDKKTEETAQTVSKDSLQGDKKQSNTETQKNNSTAKKETEEKGGSSQDASAGTSSSGTSSSGTSSAGTNDGSQSQGNTQQAATVVYDASLPEDSTDIHRYELILSDATWTEAFQDCLNRGGYLVRINSESEYEYLRKEIVKQGMTNIFFRIGGERDINSKEYHWVNQNGVLFGGTLNSEDSWCSDAWGQGEPSFKDGNLDETYMNLFFMESEKRFIWNDVPNDMLAAEPAYAGSLGYICEYE